MRPQPRKPGSFRNAGRLQMHAPRGHPENEESNDVYATPEFWLDQSLALGPAYGALIFSGLIGHGLELTMSHLPQLSSDPEARTYIRWVFPHSIWSRRSLSVRPPRHRRTVEPCRRLNLPLVPRPRLLCSD